MERRRSVSRAAAVLTNDELSRSVNTCKQQTVSRCGRSCSCRCSLQKYRPTTTPAEHSVSSLCVVVVTAFDTSDVSYLSSLLYRSRHPLSLSLSVGEVILLGFPSLSHASLSGARTDPHTDADPQWLTDWLTDWLNVFIMTSDKPQMQLQWMFT